MKDIMTKRHLLNIIFRNNRLDDYKEVIEFAQSKGYYCCSVYDYYDMLILHPRPMKKVLILRHDIDYNGTGTRKMYEIEKAHGVKATYFFRDRTIDKVIIKELINDGFDVGYHYETIANMVARGEIKEKSDIDINKVRQHFLNELEKFEKIISYRVKTCAAHGAPENMKIGVSNNFIFEGIDAKTLNIEVEAYDSRIINSLNRYVMDCGIMVNYGYAYKGYNIFEAIQHDDNKICFLTHPNHWDMTPYERLRKLIRMMIGKGVYHSDRKFKRIAV